MTMRPAFYNPHTGALLDTIPPAYVGFRIPVVSDLAEGAVDVVSSVWDRVPGSEHIDDATRALVEGPLRDFANTGVGEFTLNVIAANIAMAASTTATFMPIIGPAIIISTAAIPGLLKGDDFTNSLIEGWVWRVQTVAQILTPMVAAKFGQWTGEAGKALTNAAKKAFPNVDASDAIKQMGLNGINYEKKLREIAAGMKIDLPSIKDAEEWAKKAAAAQGVKAAALLQAYDLNSGTNFFNPDHWDLETGEYKANTLGKRKKPTGTSTPSTSSAPRTAAEMDAIIARALAAGQSVAILNALRAKRDELRRKEAIMPTLSAARARGDMGAASSRVNVSSARTPAITAVLSPTSPPVILNPPPPSPPTPVYYNTEPVIEAFAGPVGEPEVLPNEIEPGSRGLSKTTTLFLGGAGIAVAAGLIWHFTR
jgi:hypothetical protein